MDEVKSKKSSYVNNNLKNKVNKGNIGTKNVGSR